MAKFPLDLSKFKKIATDEHTATLKHPDGHSIKIAMTKLDPTMRKHLDNIPMAKESMAKPAKYAEGGEVDAEDKAPQQPSQQPSAEEDAIQSFNPIDSISDAAKLFGQKVMGTMQADTDAYQQARLAQEQGNPMLMQDWITKHAMNAAMGTISGPPKAPALPFHEAAAAQKAEQLAQGIGTPRPTVGEAIDRGLISGDKYQGQIFNRPGGGRPIQYEAEGGEIKQSNPKLEESKKVPHYAEGTPDGGVTPDLSMEKVQQAENQAADTQAPIDLIPQPAEVQPASIMQQGPVQEEQQPSAPAQPQMPEEQVPNIASGYNQQLQGIEQQAAAQGALGKQQAAALKQAAEAKVNEMAHYQQAYSDLEKERQAHMQDIKNEHIDPEKYWDNHSKLMAGLGIILAGFDPKGRPNQALDFVNHQIDRSIQAQAKNLDSQQNLLSANLHQFGNLRDASTMTRLMMNDVATNKLDQLVASSQDPMAKARALELKGKLQQQSAPMFMDMAMRKALISMNQQQAGGGQESGGNAQQGSPEQTLGMLRVLNPTAAKEMEARYVPHVGFASIPVSEKAREEITGRQSLQDQVHNLRQWSQQHSGTLNPAEVNYGKALAASVQDAYRRANGQGVFREAEADFVKGIVADDPTAFMNKYRTDPKYKALEDSNAMALNGIKKSYGLPEQSPVQRLSPQQQSFVQWAQKNPNDPRSAAILKKLGVQ